MDAEQKRLNENEIIEALATKVMGWHRSFGIQQGVHYWALADESLAALWGWNPITNPADSKQVREKLAERFDYWNLSWIRTNEKNCFRMMLHDQDDVVWDSDFQSTEEMAVALCALKTVGIEVDDGR